MRSLPLRIRLLAVFLLGISAVCHAAFTPPPDSIPRKKRYAVVPLPLLFYTPETRFGFGASVFCTFNFKNDSAFAPRSNVSLLFAYTLNKQIMSSLPFNLFLKNREYQVYGELTYNKYFFNFYGVGNDQPPGFVERFGYELPRIRLTAVKRIAPRFYLGPRYAYDKFSLFDLDTSGQLIKGEIPGSRGGTVSGFGLVALYDSRDNVYSPSRGFWGELVVYHDDPLTGSSFNYTRITLDVCKYFSYKKNIFALNAYTLYSDAELPFFQMAALGGSRRMRGFYEGRYRGNNALVFQAEYRRQLIGILGFTVFADIGQVAHRYDAFHPDNWRYTYGVGLRLMSDKIQKINLRIDIGVGNNKLLPYFTIGEAF